MQLCLLSSLEHISLINIAVHLWKHDQIRKLTTQFCIKSLFDFEIKSQWKKIEFEVLENASNVVLPGLLKTKLISFIKPMGKELLRWIKINESFLTEEEVTYKILGQVAWLSCGTVDYKNSAKCFIKEENIDISSRYKMACINCLEKDIPMLWNKLSTEQKNNFYSEEKGFMLRYNVVILYWTACENKNVQLLKSFLHVNNAQFNIDLYLFEESVCCGNFEGAKYFWHKLSLAEKQESIMSAIISCIRLRFHVSFVDSEFTKNYNEILFFLLFEAMHINKLEPFEKYPLDILKSFLVWPLQSFFTKILKLTCEWLSLKNFISLLFHILQFIMIETKLTDYDYQHCLNELWCLSPITFKRFVLHDCINKNLKFLFSGLLKADLYETISLILGEATIEEREAIILNNLSILEDSIHKSKLKLLKFFISECLSTKSSYIKLKTECTRYALNCEPRKYVFFKIEWQKFFQLLDAFIAEFSKRNLDDFKEPPTKKLCV